MKAFTTLILRRFGFRPVTALNGTAAAFFIAACGWLAPSTPLPVMLAVLFGYGLARSLQFTALATLAYADVAEAQKGPASTLWTVAQQMTLGLGIAFGALCLRLASSVQEAAGVGSPGPYALTDFR